MSELKTLKDFDCVCWNCKESFRGHNEIDYNTERPCAVEVNELRKEVIKWCKTDGCPVGDVCPGGDCSCCDSTRVLKVFFNITEEELK